MLSGATTEGQTNTLALSAFDVVNLGAKLQLNGGLRVERYDTRLSRGGRGQRGDRHQREGHRHQRQGGRPLSVLAESATPTWPTARRSRRRARATSRFSAQANNANNPNVDPQVSKNFEVGTKWELLDRPPVARRLAVFDTRNTNVIYTIDATAVPPLFNQDDGQIVRGATLGLVGQLSDHWSMMANFAYMDGTLDSQNVANDGKRITLLPEWSGSLWTTYRLPAASRSAAGSASPTRSS